MLQYTPYVMIKTKPIISLLIFICISFTTTAQSESESDFDELKKAYINIQQEQYHEAYPYFKKMLSVYPQNRAYNYYAGLCLINLNSDVEKTIRYFHFAVSGNVPLDVYFYLGIAYLKQYEFEKAITNFKLFEKKAGKIQADKKQLSNYIAMAKNGLYLVKYFREPLIYKNKTAFREYFFESYDLKKQEGRLENRYNFFEHEKDSMMSIVFVPDYLENQEILYFSARNKLRGDLDIYRTTKINDTTWSKPENLGDQINTPFDEDFPYIHSDGSTLYFASKGHYSMGGYDIYESSWDWETHKWSKPKNLDFPINTPHNDFLFIPTPDKKSAYFTSDRTQEKTQYQVYEIKLDNTKSYVEYKSAEQLRNFACLARNISHEDDDLKTKKKKRKPKIENTIVKVTNKENFLQKSEYDSLLNKAMELQLKADSAKWLIEDKRSLFDKITQEQERTKLGEEIINLEQAVYVYQKKADKCYEKVREIEQINIASKNITYRSKERVNKEKEIAKPISINSGEIVNEPTNNPYQKVFLKSINPIKEEKIEPKDIGLKIKRSAYNSKNPIRLNEKLPDGIIYLIQLGAFSSRKNPVVFKGMYPIVCRKKAKSRIYKYYAGKFRRLKNAENKLRLVKSKGFRDAYIVAFNNNKYISVKNAVKIEAKPMIVYAQKETKSKETIDVNNLIINYVIKGTIDKNNKELIDEFKKLIDKSQNIIVDSSKDKNNLIIKPFKTYKDAVNIKNKLVIFLEDEFEIQAYFIDNQIPLEQAMKITK